MVKLLRGDQSLTAKILSLAGSALYGVRGPVTTLEKAVPLLGFATVRSVVLATHVFECFVDPSGEPESGAFDRTEFWKHSLAVACAARRLARIPCKLAVEAEDAFVAGLLHDLGKVALDAVFPKAYDRVAALANQGRGDIIDSEQAVLKATHTVAGRRLSQRWGLPRIFQEAIWLHHVDPPPSFVAQPRLIEIVQLADTIAREQRIGYSGNYVFCEHSPRLAQRLGFGAENIAAVVQPLASDVAEHATLLGLDSETAELLYVKAMTRANAELGRLNTELLATNRHLTAGARYFKAISRFEHELGDWSDPSAVVAAVAKAAATALQRPRVAAFGLREHASAVDLSWVGEAAEDRGHITRAVPEDLAAWLAEGGDHVDAAIVPAPQAVRTLLTCAASLPDRGTPWLLPICHGGNVAGGVAYLSETDERQRLADETEDLRSFLASMGLALGRANAQAAARQLSDDLADTNRRLQQMQAELLRSRALSMIAEMAAGAGHELNSPLTVISGRAQMLSSTIGDPEAKRLLAAISDKAHECSRIVSELMDFARPRPAKLTRVALRELLEEVRAEWLEQRGMPPSQIRLEQSLEDPNATIVRADREQLKTVFHELLSNATDALGDSGNIVLRCRPAVQDDRLEVIVEDSGCGMAPAVLQRAFDPFYSHRDAGRRRGLGLARAYRIVESLGGRIWLESRPEEGTTAHVLLPRAGGAESG